MAEIKKKKSFLKKTRRRGNPISASQSQKMGEASLATSEEIKTFPKGLYPISPVISRFWQLHLLRRDSTLYLH